jgi:hypothetical protein
MAKSSLSIVSVVTAPCLPVTDSTSVGGNFACDIYLGRDRCQVADEELDD